MVLSTGPNPGGRRVGGHGLLLALGIGLGGLGCAVGLGGQDPPSGPSIPSLEEGVRALAESGTPGELAAAYRELGSAYDTEGMEAAAVRAFRSAISHAEAAADMPALASSHNSLGLVHWTHARYDSAVVHLDRARVLWTVLDDRASLGRAYNNLGAAHYQWGNYSSALDAFLRSLELRRSMGDRAGESLVLSNIGRTYHDWQLHDRAREVLTAAVAAGEESGNPFPHGYALHNLAILELNLGDHPRARELFEASNERYGSEHPELSEADRISGWSLNTVGLALSHVREGRPEEGIPLLEEVLARATADGHVRRQIRALVHLGEAFRAGGEPHRAVELLDRALELSRKAGQRTLALEALQELAAAHEDRGAFRAALLDLRRYQSLRDSVFDQAAVQRVAAMEAQAAADRQERENVALLQEQRIQEAVIARQRLTVSLGAGLLLALVVLSGFLVRSSRAVRIRERLLARTNAALEGSNRDLREALSEVRTLKGLIPICVHCKKVRDDEGFWEGVETYISSRSEALFSHSICADCGPGAYGQDWAPREPAAGSRGRGGPSTPRGRR